jgi:hypothetical protein
MNPGNDVERLESAFDVLERRLDDDDLPRESSEPRSPLLMIDLSTKPAYEFIHDR